MDIKQKGLLLLTMAGWIGAAHVQAAEQSPVDSSVVTIYGKLDVGLDRVSKGQGNVSGTLYSVSNGVVLSNAVASPSTQVTRVAPSLSSQSLIGVKGQEQMGGGYVAKFTLESGLAADTGSLTQDGRMWGRQAWVGVQAPSGEFRLGRQVAPMMAGYYLTSLGNLGSTDIFATGVVLNNLQVFLDNAVSYLVKQGPWLGMVSYATNGGIAARTSAVRAPVATDATGQIVGGATAGQEDASGRGRTTTGMLTYSEGGLVVSGTYNHNRLGTVIGVAGSTFVPLYQAEAYDSWMLGSKYTFNEGDTSLAANIHEGRLSESGSSDPKTRTLALSARHSMGRYTLLATVTRSEFTNFTRGKDTGLLLGSELSLSKRTYVYAGWGFVDDDRGRVVSASLTSSARLAGGPATLLVPIGSLEIPLFSGAGMNMDARTRIAAVGIRHTF
jgi:predicted porin